MRAAVNSPWRAERLSFRQPVVPASRLVMLMATVVALVFARNFAASLNLAELPFSLFSSRYLPHRYRYLAQPGLVWKNAVTDAPIGTP